MTDFMTRGLTFLSGMGAFLSKRDRVGAPPHTLIIEATNLCNLSCKMCFHSKMERPAGELSDALMERILENLKAYPIPHVQFAFGGEPFLHRRLLSYAAAIKELGISVEIFTNGMLVSEEVSRRILEVGVDIVNFSVDSTDPAVFSGIRKGANLDVVTKNLKYLHALRERENSKKPFIKLYVTRLQENRPEIEQHWFEDRFLSCVDYVYYNCRNNWLGAVDNEVILGPQKAVDRGRRCVYPYTMMVLACDGRLAMCPCDYDLTYEIGDIRTSSLEQVWNGERVRRLRGGLIRKDYSEIKMCERCMWRQINSPAKVLLNRIRAEAADLWFRCKRLRFRPAT